MTQNPFSKPIKIDLPIDISGVKGFLHDDEANALFAAATAVAARGPILEIGSYCGKSTIYLGTACKSAGSTLFALDHHRGSEEHQLGEEYHDPELYDESIGLFDSFKEFRKNIRAATLEETVVPIVASSTAAAKQWATPLSMVFIDGGHSMQAAMNDYRCWARHVMPGGLLAIHDVFPNPEDGGRPPHEIWLLAEASDQFETFPLVRSLGLFRRL